MTDINNKEQRAIRPDAQPFDEIRMVTVPRYKESELSGDEWRISVHVEFYRKGKKVFESTYSKMEYAVQLLSRDFLHVSEGNGAYYAGEGSICDQEGCSEEATVKYKLKNEFCRRGHKTDIEYMTLVRLFCDRHKNRGDCGLEDSDINYELLK